MENVSKALEIAAGTLLAVMILSLTVWVFSKLSVMPENEDNMKKVEQLAKFNMEYEVYDKKRMYGVDVISCLNKAQNNNEKYVNGGVLFGGDTYGEDYYIQVGLKIKKNLEESVEIYYYDSATKKNKLKTEAVAGETYTMNDLGFKIGNYTTFSKTKTFSKSETVEIDGNVQGGYKCLKKGDNYNYLYNESKPKEPTDLQQLLGLLRLQNDFRQTTTNDQSKVPLTKWSSAIWSTALYDLKKRTFKCDNIFYNVETGRINKIEFSEF